ncbi:hypothetical protein POUND7_012066 [Theobroma cacao]
MGSQILHPKVAPIQPEWDLEDIRMAFFKCTRWQVEETLDPINCPFHYFCDSIYPGNYPPAVDVLVLLLTTASYLATLVIMLIDISRRGRPCLSQSKRFLLPSGPVSLPLILLALANGQRINILFPLSCIAPAILQLIQISALAFDIGADKDPRGFGCRREVDHLPGMLSDNILCHRSSVFKDYLQAVRKEQRKILIYQVTIGEFSLDLDHQGLHLPGGKLSARTISATSCCFWRHTIINLPSCTQEVLHTDYAGALSLK